VRNPEQGLFGVLAAEGVGGIAFSPLAQGLLTDRYLDGIPGDSRAGKPNTCLKPADLTPARLAQVRALNAIARQRGQSLAQLALAWVLRQKTMTGALVGASRPGQIEDCVAAAQGAEISGEELARIEEVLA